MEIVTSRKNRIAAHFKRLGADAAYRRETGLYLCQGAKLYEEALAAGAGVRQVLYCGARPETPPGAEAYEASREILEYASPMPSAPELLFSCALPELRLPPPGGRGVILEDVQDPGNVGTIMRTAAAFGFGWLALAGDCADPYGPKAVRASMGAVFKTRVCRLGAGDLPGLGLDVYAAALCPEAEDAREARFPASFALAIGNEGRGLSRELLAAASRIIKIPMEEGNESLNAAAAAAVLMWEAYRSGLCRI